MKTTRVAVLTVLVGTLAFGQLTMDQKIADFQYMASVYAKRYGPYEWKRDAIKFDLLDLLPWLDKVRATRTDLEFYDVASEYVASLNDAHDGYYLPSNFVARLNFSVDVYDGKLLVDSVNRTRLPASEFGVSSGYELVSIDGQDAQKILDGLMRYSVAANTRSTRRDGASLLTVRPQQLIPNAANLPEISVVVFRNLAGGLETYRIPWAKSGVPLTSVGRYISPQSASVKRRTAAVDGDPEGEPPPYMEILRRLGTVRTRDRAILNFGAVPPVFAAAMPRDFTLRLGLASTDPFYSGVFTQSGYRIGFIRIPSYAPADFNGALNAFAREIAYFQANTDGLIVDEMRNPGGYVDYANQIVSYLIPRKWRSLGFEIRPTLDWIVDISSAYESAKALGAPPSILDLLGAIKSELVSANREGFSRTKPIPIDDLTIERDPAMDSRGSVLAYSKPLMMLIDEFSASGADAVPATLQDNGRGVLFGWRTMGAGGSVTNWYAGSYSMGIISLTESLMSRKEAVITPDYPPAPYVENIGVRPDIEVDYMTVANLNQNGRPFVDAFVAAMVDYIAKNK